MCSQNKETTATRRRALIGFGGMAATAWAADCNSGAFTIKRASLLARKPGISHEEFVKHWVEIHAPMARACPGIGRYALTIINSSSKRNGMAAFDIEVDGIAELWFKDKASFDAYSMSPATKRLRDDGATFIGREIDFIAEEKIIIS
jgi:uncharacterized protein (TIGR02118 family)